jgi:hypothetical protein
MNAMTGDGTEEGRMPDNVVSASQDLLAEWGTDYAPETMKQYLLNKGYTEEEANAAIEAHRGLGVSVLQDYSPTSVSDAQSFAYTLAEKLDSGLLTVEEYDALVEKNGSYIMQYITPALNDINAVDYTALGISQEEWDSLSDGEKKLEIWDMAGELRKENIITSNQFYDLIYTDLTDEFQGSEYQESDAAKVETWIGMAQMIEGFYNSEYINQDDYIDFMYNVIGKEMNKSQEWFEFMDSVEHAMERKGDGVTIGQIKSMFVVSPFPSDTVFNNPYGNTRKEKNAAKELLLKMAKFMITHKSTGSSTPAGNTSGSTSTGVSTGNTSMEVTQDAR